MLSKSTEFEQGPFVSLSRNTSSPTRHTTSPPPTTTPPPRYVVWRCAGWCGKVVVGRVMWHHHTTFHTTTTSATAPRPVQYPHSTTRREAQLQGPCHRTSQIELCCKTSGDFSLNTPHHLATPLQPHNNRGVLAVVVREGCGGKRGDVAPRYLPTTTTSATTHHNQSRKS